jgi:hypothetical protein
MYALLILFILFLGGLGLGFYWRWHVLWLALVCALSGFTVFLVMSDWSDFNLRAIIADTDGSAMISWLVHFAIGFFFSAVPMVVGGVAGWGLRRWRKRVCHR